MGLAPVVGAVGRRPAAVVMLAVTVVASDAHRPALAIDDDDGVHAVRLAASAHILDRLAGSVTTRL